jgi:pyruvate,water dikinase
MSKLTKRVVWFDAMSRDDVAIVGGKNASLGEMVTELSAKNVTVPPGYATTSAAFRDYIQHNNLTPMISRTLENLEDGKTTLQRAGADIRAAINEGEWPEATRIEILYHYEELAKRVGVDELSVAVRSSATAEDLPDASFAGQQETYLNVRGETALLNACRRCYASLFTDRAITYRNLKGFDHLKVALSIGVQQMVRADIGSAGVMFSIDTESGCDKVVLINAAWGLGENVVQGAITPDEYEVFKPLLTDTNLVPIIKKSRGTKEKKMVYAKALGGETKNVPTSKAERLAFVLDDEQILELARQAVIIEEHYGQPMDIEWACDGETGKLYIVQARPETVQSRLTGTAMKSYQIENVGDVLLTGLSIGSAVATGRVCLIESAADIDRFIDNSILVTSTTDPDWVPIMKRASAIITDHGGRTSHAAIVSRELGLPAIVGSGTATHILHDDQEVTVSCAGGEEGIIYSGFADITVEEIDIDDVPTTHTKVMLNLANPSAALRWWRLPVDGVGLARMEFVISNHIRVHPLALLRYDEIRDDDIKAEIDNLTMGFENRSEYLIDSLARGLARIAATVYPKPVIIRMSDFKSNEYANLLGGKQFEPKEENPMIGLRGASRYYSPIYRDGFSLECAAIKRLRGKVGFNNVVVMVPFCRTVQEADKVLDVMSANGLKRGENGLEVYMMSEIPANVVLAEQFASRFDGFSIGSNDLTQLTLGVDRDSEILASQFSEQDEAVKWMISTVIEKARATNTKVGLCGQAPSDHPEFAQFLVECGIDSISVTPDSFIQVKKHVAQAERKLDRKATS